MSPSQNYNTGNGLAVTPEYGNWLEERVKALVAELAEVEGFFDAAYKDSLYFQKRCAELELERNSLLCCCKCKYEDHDMHENWWCQFDPEPVNPNEFGTIEPHENCHFSPSKWEPKS